MPLGTTLGLPLDAIKPPGPNTTHWHPIEKRIVMDTIEHSYAPTLECTSRDAETAAPYDKDNAATLGGRPAGTNWRTEIAHLYGGRPRHAVTLGLNQAVYLYGLRCNDFLAIIDGAEMKAQTDIRAPSFAQLDRYCECAAVAVSRLLLRIFGEETPAGEHVAAELGPALQFTDILRNLTQDAKRQRLFLPRELLRTHGIFATTPSWVLAQPAFVEVCRDFAVLAKRHYEAAAEAIAACRRSTMRPAAVMLGVHRALLDALVARGWQQLDVPVRISFWRELALLLRHGLTGR